MTSWDATLLEDQALASLVRIARERRLVLENGHGPQWVDLCWVDEVALALIDLAQEHDQSSPSSIPPRRARSPCSWPRSCSCTSSCTATGSPSVGIVTADTTMAARTWNALRIATTGAREPIAEVFPCYRAGPEGESPWRWSSTPGRHHRPAVQGLAGGPPRRRPSRWPRARRYPPTRDRDVRRPPRPWPPPIEEAGAAHLGMVGGGSHQCKTALSFVRAYTVPFSVASDRLETMAHGVEVSLRVAPAPRSGSGSRPRARGPALLRSMAPTLATATSNADCRWPGTTSRR